MGPAFAGLLVDVEVDPETGKVQILRCTVAQDAGRAIHPSYVEGQMQGGTSQGLGWALNEEYVYDDKGILRNAGFLDYRMPTCLDLPLIEPRIVEVPHPGHPLGIRGVGLLWSFCKNLFEKLEKFPDLRLGDDERRQKAKRKVVRAVDQQTALHGFERQPFLFVA